MKDLLLLYLVIINAAGFVLMLADKHKAKKKLWRIPEATLMTVAALGGSVGSLLGMYTVRHKTKHPKFTVGIPLLLALQIIAAIVVPGKLRLWGIAGQKEDYVIPWACVKKVGPDIVLVDIRPQDCRVPRPKPKFPL